MNKKAVPMIHVPDVAPTVAWYREIGFEVIETYGHEGEGLSFAIVAFGESQVISARVDAAVPNTGVKLICMSTRTMSMRNTRL